MGITSITYRMHGWICRSKHVYALSIVVFGGVDIRLDGMRCPTIAAKCMLLLGTLFCIFFAAMNWMRILQLVSTALLPWPRLPFWQLSTVHCACSMRRCHAWQYLHHCEQLFSQMKNTASSIIIALSFRTAISITLFCCRAHPSSRTLKYFFMASCTSCLTDLPVFSIKIFWKCCRPGAPYPLSSTGLLKQMRYALRSLHDPRVPNYTN